MWLSKNAITKNVTNPDKAESALVTISNNEQLEMNGSTNSRNIKVFSPYGYSYIAPNGEEALLLPSSFGKATVGTRMKPKGIQNGEIKISNKSGAYIWLKNDGSVEINGRVFEKGGALNDVGE